MSDCWASWQEHNNNYQKISKNAKTALRLSSFASEHGSVTLFSTTAAGRNGNGGYSSLCCTSNVILLPFPQPFQTSLSNAADPQFWHGAAASCKHGIRPASRHLFLWPCRITSRGSAASRRTCRPGVSHMVWTSAVRQLTTWHHRPRKYRRHLRNRRSTNGTRCDPKQPSDHLWPKNKRNKPLSNWPACFCAENICVTSTFHQPSKPMQ